MPNRRELFATLLPVAAVALLVHPVLGLTEDVLRQGPMWQASSTLDAAPPSRATARGARPTTRQPERTHVPTDDDAARFKAHPRRQHDSSRVLPQAADGIALAEYDPRTTAVRGSRAMRPAAHD